MKTLECITLFVEDLAATKRFYQQVFDPKTVYEDAVSTVFAFENVMINLLKISEAPQLIVPAKVADRQAGQRLMFTILVKDVDALCAKLASQGLQILNGPLNRPWGRRTAAFADPAGHVWELAQEISK